MTGPLHLAEKGIRTRPVQGLQSESKGEKTPSLNRFESLSTCFGWRAPPWRQGLQSVPFRPRGSGGPCVSCLYLLEDRDGALPTKSTTWRQALDGEDAERRAALANLGSRLVFGRRVPTLGGCE